MCYINKKHRNERFINLSRLELEYNTDTKVAASECTIYIMTMKTTLQNDTSLKKNR